MKNSSDNWTERLKYKCSTAEALLKNTYSEMKTPEAEKDESHESGYDIVCALEVIEHVSDPRVFLRDCVRLAKPNGGLVFVSTINRTPLANLLAIKLAENILRVVPRGTHDYKKFVRPAELHTMVDAISSNSNSKENDISANVISLERLIYNPITGSWQRQTQPSIPSLRPLTINYIACIRRN
jgi:2-polyprenyl-6-hydroxyphenyl methylase / 3-demethylubiquinone-9 3-methyltransferase